MNTLVVKAKETTRNGQTGWEGTVELTGLRPTKLARKDGVTLFPSKSALTTTARALSKRLGWELTFELPATKAAKKSVKSATKPAAKKASPKTDIKVVSPTCCCSESC